MLDSLAVSPMRRLNKLADYFRETLNGNQEEELNEKYDKIWYNISPKKKNLQRKIVKPIEMIKANAN